MNCFFEFAYKFQCRLNLLFQPTRSDRGWFINGFTSKNPWYAVFAGIPPALFATILIFMDQQITAVIINRKEHKLRVRSSFN